MHTRRKLLTRSARLAGMLATLGLLPLAAGAQAAGYPGAALEAKNMADLMKALGAGAPAESRDVGITGPDIAENGAVVPVGATSTLPGVKRMLLIGMLAWALRYTLFAMLPSTPAMLLFGIVLHGICYDFFFVTGQLYTDRVAPKGIRTSAQAFLGLMTYGAGMLVGNYVLGFWGDRIGLNPTTQAGWLDSAKQFWLLPAGLAGGVAVLFFLTFWDRNVPVAEPTTGDLPSPDSDGGTPIETGNPYQPAS